MCIIYYCTEITNLSAVFTYWEITIYFYNRVVGGLIKQYSILDASVPATNKSIQWSLFLGKPNIELVCVFGSVAISNVYCIYKYHLFRSQQTARRGLYSL